MAEIGGISYPEEGVPAPAAARVEPEAPGGDAARGWSTRLYGIVLALGAGGLVAAVFSLLTGIGRVSVDRQHPRALDVLGLTVSYPYANAPAIVLVTLAAIGALALAATAIAAIRCVSCWRPRSPRRCSSSRSSPACATGSSRSSSSTPTLPRCKAAARPRWRRRCSSSSPKRARPARSASLPSASTTCSGVRQLGGCPAGSWALAR